MMIRNCKGLIKLQLIIGGSGSGKTNALLNLVNNQPDIDKIYFYAKDPYGAKYKSLINQRESPVLKHFNDPKAFIEYSYDMKEEEQSSKILKNTIQVKMLKYLQLMIYDCRYD